MTAHVKLQAQEQRKRVEQDVKREFIRSAAKELFVKHGLEGTSVREIARMAGYTTGAIYFYYPSKEALYADILRSSLEALHERVAAANDKAGEAIDGLGAAFRALVAFYDEFPRDLDLSLYLFQGAQPRGLTPEANRDLNDRLLATMDIYRVRFAALGVSKKRLSVEVAGLFDEMIGALIAAHTGRLRLLGVTLEQMVQHHVANLRARLEDTAHVKRGA